MRELIDRSEFIRSLDDVEFDKGCIKLNIPKKSDLTSLYGEGVSCWIYPEDRVKVVSSTFHDRVKAILLNVPSEYENQLKWGTEILIRCHGEMRPTLDPEWVKYTILGDNL